MIEIYEEGRRIIINEVTDLLNIPKKFEEKRQERRRDFPIDVRNLMEVESWYQ